ncbi:pilus assembly protein PilM [Neisseriaceae bacterium JH1-16]|nr:pilus assembly protein PilM [Neisseriaceae bacterium JH1-16]
MLLGKLTRGIERLQRLASPLRDNRPRLGLDLGEHAIKLVELSRQGQHHRLERYRIEPLPAGLLVDGRPVELERLAARLRRSCEQLDSRVSNVALAMPTSLTLYQTLRLPFCSPEALDSLVREHAARLLPIPLDDASLDYQVLGPSPLQPELCEVLIGAARREHVEERLAVVELAGLTPVAVELAAFAALGALAPPHDDTVALIDLNGRQLRCLLSRGGLPLQYREHTMSLAPQGLEAPAFAASPWSQPRSAEAHASPPIAAPTEALAQELERLLPAWQQGDNPSSLDAVWLSGGASRTPNLAAAVSALTQRPCRLADPFTAMTLAPAIAPDRLRHDAPALLTACGLALHGDRR